MALHLALLATFPSWEAVGSVTTGLSPGLTPLRGADRDAGLRPGGLSLWPLQPYHRYDPFRGWHAAPAMLAL